MSNDTDDVFDRAADAIWVCSWFIAALWFLGIVGYQVFYWLQFGSWLEMPLVTVFHHFDLKLTAIYEPQSWIGIARITAWVLGLPLSLVGALLILWLAWAIRDVVRGQSG